MSSIHRQRPIPQAVFVAPPEIINNMQERMRNPRSGTSLTP